MNAPRDEFLEAVNNALQDAVLLTGYLRRVVGESGAELTKLHAALERARSALRDRAGRASGQDGGA